MYIYKKIDNIMKTNEKLMPWDESKPRWSISIKNEGNWEEIGHTDDVRDAVELNRLKSVIEELKANRSELIEMIDQKNLLIDELKVERNKLNDKIDKKYIDSKQDFEEIQKLKKSNRVGEVIIGFLTTSILIYTIYNLM